ncbi:MAG: hypothetical protein ABJM43_22605 [Paracoccaceae bacterium]
MIARAIFIILAVCALAGGYYLSINSVWQESRDLDRSVRIGGVGGGINGRVK